MTITSSIYLAFLAVLLFVYYVFPKKIQWVFLLAFSFVFIFAATTDIKVYFYILYAVLVSFFGALIINKSKTEKHKKIAQTITVLLMFLMLFFLKYLNFFAQSIVNTINIFGTNLVYENISIIAPIGVTFYTLIAIGYVIDVGRGVVIPQKNIFKYALFVLYFPQLTSGPFTRYSEMEKTLFAEHNFELKNILFGFQRILWGIFKKLVISERMAVIVTTVFSNYTEFSGIYVMIGAVAFAIQLYTDFSGCMDIIIGSSEALGIALPENFDTPYFSRNISEYWRRWHITLGTWFKDYFFYPILKSNIFQKLQSKCKDKFGKKWGKRIPTYLGMFILWFTVGAWHGGATKYIIGSGLLHWFYIVGGEICKPAFDKLAELLKINTESLAFRIWQSIRTFALVCVGFVFFRADSTSQALEMLKLVFVNNYFVLFTDGLLNLGLTRDDLVIAMFSTCILFIISLLKQKYKIREEISKQHIIIRYSIWLILIMSILIYGYYGIGYDAASFIYQNF